MVVDLVWVEGGGGGGGGHRLGGGGGKRLGEEEEGSGRAGGFVYIKRKRLCIYVIKGVSL